MINEQMEEIDQLNKRIKELEEELQLLKGNGRRTYKSYGQYIQVVEAAKNGKVVCVATLEKDLILMAKKGWDNQQSLCSQLYKALKAECNTRCEVASKNHCENCVIGKAIKEYDKIMEAK